MAFITPKSAAPVAFALLCAFTFVFGAGAAAAMPAPPAGAQAAPRESVGGQVTSFYFGKSMLITPISPFNDTHGQTADAPGVSFPRTLITNVGTWTVTLSEEGMALDSLDGLSIWASSDQGAQNARFTVNVELNGNNVGTLNTETKSLSASPEELRMDAGNSRMNQLAFPKGSQLGFNLQYRSTSSPLPVGPSKGSTFYYYSDLYRSRVDFVTNPFNLTLAGIKMENRAINLTEIVKDAFSVPNDNKFYTVTFNGPTNSQDAFVKQVETRVDPVNGTTLVWNWDFETQGTTTSGDYFVTLSARYDGAEVNYTNVSSASIEFPKSKKSAGGFLPGFEGLAGVAAIASVATMIAVSRARHVPPRRR
jgi:hypothetical protein